MLPRRTWKPGWALRLAQVHPRVLFEAHEAAANARSSSTSILIGRSGNLKANEGGDQVAWNAVLATQEAPVEAAYKRAVVARGGDDTIVTTVSHTLSGRDWPGAWARLR